MGSMDAGGCSAAWTMPDTWSIAPLILFPVHLKRVKFIYFDLDQEWRWLG
jgi:hypothetical protein